MADPSLLAQLLVSQGVLSQEDAEALESRLHNDPSATWASLLSVSAGEPQETELAPPLEYTRPRADTSLVTMESPDRYEGGELLGRGGMGVVTLVYDRHLCRNTARKGLLSAPGGTDPTFSSQARFLREARITAGLEHPGIVPVYELGQTVDGSLYYTMKRIRGRTLRKALEQATDLSSRLEVFDHFIDACQAMGLCPLPGRGASGPEARQHHGGRLRRDVDHGLGVGSGHHLD